MQPSVTWAFHNMSINLEIPLSPPNNPRIMICKLHHIYLQGIVFISIHQSKMTPICSPNMPCNLMRNPTFVAIKTTVLKRSYKTPCNNFSETEHIFLLKRKLLSDFGNSDMRQPSIPFERNRDLSVCHNLYNSQHEHLRQSAARPAGGVSVTSGNSGSAISSKTRIRWTQDLHDCFVECVNHLGGAEKATPKAILKLIDSERLTIFHVKSHFPVWYLDKYRIAKYMPDSAEGKSERKNNMNDAAQIDIKACLQIREALQLQLDVQRRLHEQLEIQRNLQLRIEKQGKQLKMMFDQQQKTSSSLFEMHNSNNTSPDEPIAYGSGNTHFPSKIS
ncbi:myb family transcription factor PHL5-like [Camellia sinensis]|uniref:myb family transcription factor PHL5-like n=1 Tax=Camellia sinensis TaxID=4442 RepID=UPI001036B99E|nr:myb family transcription factor PHL5-like [Camellia sinensis]